MSFAEKVKLLRNLHDLSQEELGEKLGVQRSAINKYERGRVENISVRTLEKLANIFDVTPNYLLGWEENPNDPLDLDFHVNQGIKRIYGSSGFKLLENYSQLSSMGKKKLLLYMIDLLKLYPKP